MMLASMYVCYICMYQSAQEQPPDHHHQQGVWTCIHACMCLAPSVPMLNRALILFPHAGAPSSFGTAFSWAACPWPSWR